MPKSTIELKGSTFTLPVIYLNNSDPHSITTELTEKVQQAPSMLKNAAVVVNVSLLKDNIDLSVIREAILAAGINIVGISGWTERKKLNAQKIGLPILSEGKTTKSTPSQSTTKTPPANKNIITESTIPNPPLIIESPVRSGQQIYAQNRDLIVTAAVSPGAELIADGNIHIYSKMKGKVIAGANNNTQAKIYCTQLEAELISIAGNYWVAEQIPAEYYGKSVRISLRENTLHINSLHID